MRNKMQNRDAFSSYHPLVNFLYFALVLVFAMFFTHPTAQAISLMTALIYAAQLNERKALGKSLVWLLPMMGIAVIVNPAFNHAGATIPTYLPTGDPLTLESILYGISAGTLLAAVIVWFQCYTAVMTSDKFIYLFGRIIPALSLVLSMNLRFVPKFKAQLQAVTEAQRCMGRDVSEGTVRQRTKTAVTILSSLITWALENAIETADSMKSRGYGLPGRTAFSIYPGHVPCAERTAPARRESPAGIRSRCDTPLKRWAGMWRKLRNAIFTSHCCGSRTMYCRNTWCWWADCC